MQSLVKKQENGTQHQVALLHGCSAIHHYQNVAKHAPTFKNFPMTGKKSDEGDAMTTEIILIYINIQIAQQLNDDTGYCNRR